MGSRRGRYQKARPVLSQAAASRSHAGEAILDAPDRAVAFRAHVDALAAGYAVAAEQTLATAVGRDRLDDDDDDEQGALSVQLGERDAATIEALAAQLAQVEAHTAVLIAEAGRGMAPVDAVRSIGGLVREIRALRTALGVGALYDKHGEPLNSSDTAAGAADDDDD